MINVWTDAGCLIDQSRGSWAYIIELENDTIKESGEIPHCNNSNDAEIYAILKATELLCCESPHEGMVTYWTDSLHAIKILIGNKSKNYKSALKLINLLNIVDYQYTFNYLPRNTTPQLKWCDTNANLKGVL